MPSEKPKARSLYLDRARFTETERLAVYEIANTILLAHSELQRAFDLRAEEFQVFSLIAIVTPQRYVRGSTHSKFLSNNAPLTQEQSGSISRRRIAETLGIPLETVRRHVEKLSARGLIVERGRGRISTPGGTLARLSVNGITLSLVKQQLALTNILLQLGVLTDSRPDKQVLPATSADTYQFASVQIRSDVPSSSVNSSRETGP